MLRPSHASLCVSPKHVSLSLLKNGFFSGSDSMLRLDLYRSLKKHLHSFRIYLSEANDFPPSVFKQLMVPLL